MNAAWPPVQWIPSPHHYRGRAGRPVEFLVIHYTAGRGDVRGVGRVFRSRPASATFAVDRAGDIGQYVAAEDAAWHAGDGLLPSAADFDAFEGRPVPLIAGVGDINRRSVGIELCNRGWAPGGSNPYVTARHRNPAARSTSWESYTKAQYQGLLADVVALLGPTTWGHSDEPAEALDLFEKHPPWCCLRVPGRVQFRTGTNPRTGTKYSADNRKVAWWVWADGVMPLVRNVGDVVPDMPAFATITLPRLPKEDRRWTTRPGTEETR